MILASWAMSCVISERSSWKRRGFDARAEDHHGGVSSRGAARARRRIPGGRRAGGDFATSNSVAVLLPNPDFQHLVRVQSPLRHAELAASLGRYNGLSLPPEFQHQIRGTTATASSFGAGRFTRSSTPSMAAATIFTGVAVCGAS